MREKHIEQALMKEVKRMGGIPLKLSNIGMDGMPDRLVLLPIGKAGFIELKASGKPLRPLQEMRKRQLEALGFLVFRVDGAEQIRSVISKIMEGVMPDVT